MESTTLEKKSDSFSLRPLSPALGAEILGIDLRDPIDDALKQEFLDAWHQHLVLLLRNQTLDEDAQVRFAETFGTLAKTTSGRAFSAKHPSVMLVSNIREDGKPIGALPDGEMHFHTDQCHQATPAKATMLYAIAIPSKGGNTLFANAYTAYETLPEDIRRRIAGRRALNAYTSDTMLRSANYDDAREESEAILQQLFDHQEQPKFVYEHVWRVGDIVMWDNRCTLHARSDFSAGERRLLRRVTILGEKPV